MPKQLVNWRNLRQLDNLIPSVISIRANRGHGRVNVERSVKGLIPHVSQYYYTLDDELQHKNQYNFDNK